MNNYDYPIGADNSSAPWNQNDNEATILKRVTVSETLSRTVDIPVTVEVSSEINEDGDIETEYNTENVDWNKEYYHQYNSIENVLKGINSFMFYLTQKYKFSLGDISTIQSIIASCNGWHKDESEVVLDE